MKTAVSQPAEPAGRKTARAGYKITNFGTGSIVRLFLREVKTDGGGPQRHPAAVVIEKTGPDQRGNNTESNCPGIKLISGGF
jgi:hypothetical protein